MRRFGEVVVWDWLWSRHPLKFGYIAWAIKNRNLTTSVVLDFDIFLIYDITLITPHYKYAILCKKKLLQTQSSQLLETNVSSISSVNHEQKLDCSIIWSKLEKSIWLCSSLSLSPCYRDIILRWSYYHTSELACYFPIWLGIQSIHCYIIEAQLNIIYRCHLVIRV